LKALYDAIGAGYAALRRPDPRLALAIVEALGDARSVVNVGAGTGSYEPPPESGRRVIAVEPSRTMIDQRGASAAPVVQASATQLPFADRRFDASLAVLTVHHWPDRARGLTELARVARGRVVVVTFDPAASRFWLVDEYFPDVLALDRTIFPSVDELTRALGPVDVRPFPVPHDCVDGFLGAYWRRPAAYLDAPVRAAISSFAALSPSALEDGLSRLGADLASGAWARRHADLLSRSELDVGYRLVVAGTAPPT
jgi:SAM-dependent methyltransferase